MLISDLLKLKKYVPTVMGNEFERYSTFLQTADEYLVTELIGQALYDKLSGETVDAKLLRYCENMVCQKAYLDAIPMLDLVETETGFGVTSNTNIAPASQQRVAALAKGIETRLSDGIEQLLEYLEGNATFRSDWKGAKAYTINHDSYIFTLAEFRRYARYDGSRLEWIKDISKVTQAIRLNIEPLISAGLSSAIILQLQSGSLNEANKKIIEDLRFSLASFVTGNEAVAQSALFRARGIIVATPADYPEYMASAFYATSQTPTPTYNIDQSIANFGV